MTPQTHGLYNFGFDAAGQHIGLVPGGDRRVATVTDADGNVLGLLQDR